MMYKLLIADDNAVQIESVMNFVKWEELKVMEIKTVSNGKECYDTALKLRPDIVITDIDMPIMDGIEMTDLIKKELTDTQFIFISCHEKFDYAVSAVKFNVVDYLLKPLDPQLLKAAAVKAIKNIQERNKTLTLENRFQESKELFKEQFIQDLLNGKYTTRQQIDGIVQNFDMNKYQSFLVTQFEIVPNDRIIEDCVATFDILDCAKRRLRERLTLKAFVRDFNKIILFIMSEKCDRDEFFEQTLKALEDFSLYIKEKFDFKVNIALSKVSDNVLDANLMLKQSAQAMEMSFHNSQSNICLYDHLCVMEDALYDINQLREDILYVIENPSESSLGLFFDKYYKETKYYSKGSIKSLCFSVITVLQLLMNQHNLSFEDIFGNQLVVWEKLARFETILDVRVWLYNILHTVITYIQNSEQSKYMKIIQDIKDIIDKDYATIENIGEVVEGLYISVSYAKSIFKKYTGETIFCYLLTKKMEAAARMLKDPYIKIYEVANSLGYSSNTYFTNAFKNFSGYTPTEYRQRFAEKG